MVKTLNVVWSKTKKNVENIINIYLYYYLSVDDNSICQIDDFYMLNQIHILDSNPYSNVSSDEKKKRIEFINYVRLSFNKLTSEERKIIYWTYFDRENKYDDRFIANSLGFSLGYYYIKKKDALIRFAYSLGVEEINDK